MGEGEERARFDPRRACRSRAEPLPARRPSWTGASAPARAAPRLYAAALDLYRRAWIPGQSFEASTRCSRAPPAVRSPSRRRSTQHRRAPACSPNREKRSRRAIISAAARCRRGHSDPVAPGIEGIDDLRPSLYLGGELAARKSAGRNIPRESANGISATRLWASNDDAELVEGRKPSLRREPIGLSFPRLKAAARIRTVPTVKRQRGRF